MIYAECPECGNDGAHPVCDEKYDGNTFTVVVKCVECGCVFDVRHPS